MLVEIATFFKSLMGGKGTLQVGKDQKSGTTAGANSPVMNAGRDVIYQVPPASSARAEQEAELLAELQELMPEILENIRENLKHDPLLSTIIVLERSSIAYNCRAPHLKYADDTHPDATRKFEALERHGLVRKRTSIAYEMSPRFVRMLRGQP